MQGSPFGDPFSPAMETQADKADKSSIVEEAEDLLSAADKISEQAAFARKTKNRVWLAKLEGYAVKLGKALAEFIHKAIVLAVFKFVAELCAMILNQIMEALFKKGGQRMDITTPNVMYTGNGAQVKQAPPGQQAADPFSRHYGQSIW